MRPAGEYLGGWTSTMSNETDRTNEQIYICP